MKVVNERSAIASYDLGMRTQAQQRDTLPQQRVRNARPPERVSTQRQPGKMAGLSLQLNQQSSSIQAAHLYLTQVTEQLSSFKRDLGRSLNGPAKGGLEGETLARSVKRLNDLLENRSRLSAASVDAQMGLNLDQPLRSRFSIQGLESLNAVQASGSETLLFSAGRHMPGPIAVVLDDDMNERQILRRFNTSLAQAGLHAEVNGEAKLRFSATESQWGKLKGQMSIQGEDKLFAGASFTPVHSKEENLLGAPLIAPKGTGRAELRQLMATVDKGLVRVNGVIEQLNQRQGHVREQIGRHESKDEKRWAHDFAGRVFEREAVQGSDYLKVAQLVQCQANVSRHRVVGLMG